MFVLGNFFIAVGVVLDRLLSILWILILIRALLSWVNPDPYNVIVQFFYRTTEPVLSVIRRYMHRIFPPMMIDFSPIIAFFLIIFLQVFLARSIIEFGDSLKAQTLYRTSTTPRVERQEKPIDASNNGDFNFR